MTAQPADDAAIAALQREISRVQACSAARAADPALARALERLTDWQVRRMRATYADLDASARYAPAMTFFTTDLYGSPDFARRDGNLMRECRRCGDCCRVTFCKPSWLRSSSMLCRVSWIAR